MTHDVACHFALFVSIAVHRAFCAGGLGAAVGTFLQSLPGVIEKRAAFRARRIVAVPVGARDRHHVFHGAKFTSQASVFQAHGGDNGVSARRGA